MPALLSAATLLGLGGAANAQAETPIRVRYLCTGRFDATEVTALFFNSSPSEVILLSGSDGAARLPQQRSGSGARYAQGDETFWIKGEQASWQRGQSPTLACTTRAEPLSSGSPAPTR